MLPGPAIRTYYEVPPVLRSNPDLNFPAHFRAELSKAYSTAYHLKPHAITLSYLEDKPIEHYIDYEVYALSNAYYQHPRSAAIDMFYTRADVVASRRLTLNSQLPRQNNDTDW